MDPRVLREGSEAVCEAVIEAVNAALDDLRSQVMAEAGAFDLERMRDDLERLQAESLETARTLFGAVHEAMARIERNR
jgi:hypothetical protein